MKRCCHCHIEKPLSEFHRWASKPDGHHYECKACRHRYFDQNRTLYAERAKLAMRRYRARKKAAS